MNSHEETQERPNNNEAFSPWPHDASSPTVANSGTLPAVPTPARVARQHFPVLESQPWTSFLLLILFLHIASGCGYTLSAVWQDNLVLRTYYATSPDAPPNRIPFVHPFIQTFFILLGQAVNLPIAIGIRWSRFSSQRRSTTNDVLPPPTQTPHEISRLRRVMVFMVLTSFMETAETTMCIFSLTLMDASVFSMMRISQLLFATGLQVFVIPRFEIFFASYLRRGGSDSIELEHSAAVNNTAVVSHYSHHDEEDEEVEPPTRLAERRPLFTPVHFSNNQLAGLCSVVIGVLIVSAAAQYELERSPTADVMMHHSALSTALGCVLVLAAMCILSTQMAVHEYVLRNYNDVIEPIEMIGFQGLGCVVFSLVSIGCINQFGGHSVHDDVVQFLFQISDGWMAPLSLATLVFCTTIVDGTGTYLTRAMTANVRPALQPMRSAVIWIVGLISHTSSFSLIRLLGFTMSAVGAMVFKKMITPPTWLSIDPKKSSVVLTNSKIEQDKVTTTSSPLTRPTSPRTAVSVGCIPMPVTRER